ncbi:hypothetical protein So717_04910 [Roseobacter cerasinus]|uniref:Secreted protein n=1 Tax=Roseobacter cerasinus TaxID=2602289 RepID=A0A640VJV5_9RHOB|nr:hypothetical protein [Roseobacter cerasinus]GFE48738.1 hypothetical protein So717_04910 [Roseobacter cerasinus]
MVKHLTALAFGAALLLPASAQGAPATTAKATLVEYSSPMLPPANYRGQWWTTPDHCQYSRAGRPGETVWYLIVNTAHEGCKRRLIQRAYSDYE